MSRITSGIKATLAVMSSWFRTGGSAHSISYGPQTAGPTRALVAGQDSGSVDYALQISTIWRCVELLSKVISTLPVFVYRNQENGMRDLARTDRLYYVFHDRPNPYMTCAEFWLAMLLNLLLKGNAYARIDRACTPQWVEAGYHSLGRPFPDNQSLHFHISCRNGA